MQGRRGRRRAGGEGVADAMDIEARVGVPFELKVEHLGTAGYQWTPVALPDSVALLDAQITPPASGAPPGSSAEQCFRFLASREGRFEIVLERKRVWEAKAAATRRVVVDVR